jgi:serine/threonine protein kinase
MNDNTPRQKWCLQLAETLAHVHEHGIVHSNLSPSNVLVHNDGETTSLVLADFGGSRCRDLGVDGNFLPDPPFRDPKYMESDVNSPRLDVFGLGMLIYIIGTGHYPFHEGPMPRDTQRWVYEDSVDALLAEGEFLTCFLGMLLRGVAANAGSTAGKRLLKL